ncbi:restriction endonuclease subunit S [Paenibacillus wynnii]|uniref:restriction endonuclease subunit S n=1 Tax=Paenibacillus wynnii TaxID=268407 RepID=UPI00278CDC43|nr:restriction endonuclease subunit S [Paenibacillus wynnii]MDQ0195828.1 type I restriction enzyme S subunit [Paenibacillus wynnii]
MSSNDQRWEEVKLLDLISIRHGYAFQGEFFSEVETSNILLTPGNFKVGGGFNDSKYKYYKEEAFVPEDYILQKDDLIISMTDLSKNGDSLGFPALIDKLTGKQFLHNQRIGKVVLSQPDKIDQTFLYYSLCTRAYRHHVLSTSTGSTVKHTAPKRILEYSLLLPSIQEQRQIGKILAELDKKIQLNNAINKNLEEMAQAVFKQWFVDFEFPNENGEPYKPSGGELEESEFGLIPKGWKVGIATDIFNVQSGGTPKTGISEYWNGEIPFFTPKDTTNSFHVIDTEKKVTDEGLSKCNSKLYEMGTVFITARGTVGKLAIAGRDMAMNQSCYALVSKNGYTQKYIFLQTQQLINKIKKSATGAVFDAITVSTFQSLKTIIPNLDLVMRFDNIVEGIFSSLLNNANENQILSNLRDTLLPKLMSGEIRVPVEQEYAQAVDLTMVAESSEKYSAN